jgi:hypothetical protein
MCTWPHVVYHLGAVHARGGQISLVKDEMHFLTTHLKNMVLSNLLFCRAMSITSVLYGSGEHAVSVG